MKALKKHRTLEEDVEGFSSAVQGLEKEANRLVTGGHFDASNITARQVDNNVSLM